MGKKYYTREIIFKRSLLRTLRNIFFLFVFCFFSKIVLNPHLEGNHTVQQTHGLGIHPNAVALKMEIDASPAPAFALRKVQPSLRSLNLTLCDQKNSHEPGNHFRSDISLARGLLLITTCLCHQILVLIPWILLDAVS